MCPYEVANHPHQVVLEDKEAGAVLAFASFGMTKGATLTTCYLRVEGDRFTRQALERPP